jgi:hypothetical protein
LFLYYFVPSEGSRSQAHATLTCWGRSHDAMRLLDCRGLVTQVLHRLQTVWGRTLIKAPPPTQLQRVICKLITTIWAMKIKGACNLQWERSTTAQSSPLNQATASMCALSSSATAKIGFVWTIRLNFPPTYFHHWQYSPFWAIAFLRRFRQIASGFRFSGFRNNIFFFAEKSQPCVQPPIWRTRSLYLCPPQWQGGPVIPPGTEFPFRRLLRPWRLPWRYSNSPPREEHLLIYLLYIYKILLPRIDL